MKSFLKSLREIPENYWLAIALVASPLIGLALGIWWACSGR